MNDSFRQQFPSLQRRPDGNSIVFLDGPGGTQVPIQVIEAISQYYKSSNANTHGPFLYSRETDHVMDTARVKMANLLGASGPECISFGQNMTTLNFALSTAIRRAFQPGDEILITQLDHEANRGPWLSLREHGIVVKEIKLTSEGILDYDDFKAKINERTRLVAIGYASNILGTINQIQLARKLTYEVGAWLLIDAVHYVPHFPVDVQSIDCDFLLCSAYKFYGPHVGILYSRPGLLDRLSPNRLRTADQIAPFSIETGTLNHAAIAGVSAAVDFIAAQGEGSDERTKITNAMSKIRRHEASMVKKLYYGLTANPKISIIGPSIESPERAPTLAILAEGKTPQTICNLLGQNHIFAWDGHFYALRATEILGVISNGGVTRLGISAYTNAADIDKTLTVFENILSH